MEDIIVRYMDLPVKVRAYTATDENNDYNIYVNSRLSAEGRQRALSHELEHIRMGHFFSPLSAKAAEARAEGRLIFRVKPSDTPAPAVKQRPCGRLKMKKRAAGLKTRPDYLYRLRLAAGISREKIEKTLHISHNDYTLYEFGKKPCPRYLFRAIEMLLKRQGG